MEIVFKMQKMSRDAQNVLQRGTLIQITVSLHCQSEHYMFDRK